MEVAVLAAIHLIVPVAQQLITALFVNQASSLLFLEIKQAA